jgi:hypothetical protein
VYQLLLLVLFLVAISLRVIQGMNYKARNDVDVAHHRMPDVDNWKCWPTAKADGEINGAAFEETALIFFGVPAILIGCGIFVDMCCDGLRKYFLNKAHRKEFLTVIPGVALNTVCYYVLDKAPLCNHICYWPWHAIVWMTYVIVVLLPTLTRYRNIARGLRIDANVRHGDRLTKSAHFLWINRYLADSTWLQNDLIECTRHNEALYIDLYATREKTDIARPPKLRRLIDFSSGRHSVRFGRPRWGNVFPEIYAKLKEHHGLQPGSVVGVFACGSHALTNDIAKACVAISVKTGVVFQFQYETF